MKTIELAKQYYKTSGLDIPDPIQKLIIKTELLEKSFKKYGKHNLGCNNIRVLDAKNCPCGYRNALEDLS